MQKDKLMGFAGLGVAAAGIGLFLLSLLGELEGMMYLMGYFFGASLVLCGLIMAFVYFWRYGRIQRLFHGDALLARWPDGDGEALISARNAYVAGTLYEWAIPGTRLDEVCITPASGGAAQVLEITLAEGRVNRGAPLPASNFWKTSLVRVRIPAGQEAVAIKVASEISRFKKQTDKMAA